MALDPTSVVDWYLSTGAPPCAACGEPLAEWTGTGPPRAGLVWREGRRHPVEHRVSFQRPLPAERLTEFTLPATFTIEARCSCGWRNERLGWCLDAVWSGSEPVSPWREVVLPSRHGAATGATNANGSLRLTLTEMSPHHGQDEVTEQIFVPAAEVRRLCDALRVASPDDVIDLLGRALSGAMTPLRVGAWLAGYGIRYSVGQAG